MNEFGELGQRVNIAKQDGNSEVDWKVFPLQA